MSLIFNFNQIDLLLEVTLIEGDLTRYITDY